MQASRNPTPITQPPKDKDKQFQVKIPQVIKQAGKIQGAAYIQFGEIECLALFNNKEIYFIQIVKEAVGKYSRYQISGIVSLVSIIRGYLLILTNQRKLWLLQVKKIDKVMDKSDQQPEKVLSIESYLKQLQYSSYSIRQVTPNMVQLLITTSTMHDKTQKVIYIYQFTIKHKVGGMGFTLDRNYKISSNSRKQLYASKTFYDPGVNILLKFKNFSDMHFVVKKITEQFVSIIPVNKTEQYVGLTKNGELVNPENSSQRKKVKDELKNYNIQNGIFHMQYMLLESINNENVGLFIVEQLSKVRLLGTESKQYKWQICFNGKLVGIKNDFSTVRVTKELNRKNYTSTVQKFQVNDLQNPAAPKKQQQISSQKQAKQTFVNSPSNKDSLNEQIKPSKVDQPQKVADSSNNTSKSEQPEPSKDKSNFKPSKIISRKDLKKQKASDSINEQKIQALPQIKKDEEKLSVSDASTKQNQKQDQQSIESTKPITVQIKEATKNYQNLQKKHQQVLENKQKFNQEATLDVHKNQVQNKEIPTKPSQKIQKQMNQSQNPFLKKIQTPIQKVSGISNINVSYQAIFGQKSNDPLKSNSSLFSRPNDAIEQQKYNPFKKKQQKLIIQDGKQFTQNSKQAQNVQFQKNQKQSQSQHIITAKKQVKQEHISQLQINQKQHVSQTQKIKKTNTQVSDDCCIYLTQTKSKLQSFYSKVQGLQKKSQQIVQSFEGVGQKILNQTKQEFNKIYSELIPVSQQKAIKSINTTMQSTFNEYMSKKLTPKINDYFKSILPQTKKIFDSTLKFYSDKKKESVISLQYHFQEQEHLVNQIRLISDDMLTCVENTVIQGEESHAYLLKQWEKTVAGLNQRLDANLESVDDYTNKKSANQRQKIIDTLAELKQLIVSQDAKSKKSKQKSEQQVKPIKPQKIGKQNKKQTLEAPKQKISKINKTKKQRPEQRRAFQTYQYYTPSQYRPRQALHHQYAPYPYPY